MLGATALSPILPGPLLPSCAFVCGIVVAAGAVLLRLGVPRSLVAVAQLAVLAETLALLFYRETLRYAVLPWKETALESRADTVNALDGMNRLSAPLPPAGGRLLVVFFIAYYCGGYVAGGMARFNGAKQGLAVWLWAIAAAVVIAVLVAIGADEYNILIDLNNFPRIPVDEGDVTTTGIVVAVAVALSALVGAVLGGMAGMRFHRKVDRAGLGS